MNDSPVALSAIVITCNAEAGLGRCLTSLKGVADRIVVVDSGSADSTLEIAWNHGATIVEQPWLGFGPQKRFAVSRSPTDWVLCIDSDEWLSDELRDSIIRFKRKPTHRVYRIVRRNRFLGRFLRYGEGYPDRIVRLFHREFAQWSEDVVHEKVLTDCPIGRLKGDLYHDSAESLESYLIKQNHYTTLQAERIIADGKVPSPVRAFVGSAFRFLRGYFFKGGILDGFPGLVHMAIASSNTFCKYAKAVELKRQEEADGEGRLDRME